MCGSWVWRVAVGSALAGLSTVHVMLLLCHPHIQFVNFFVQANFGLVDPGVMILGIGVDVCHIPRIARLATQPRFSARILSLAERERFGVLPETERVRFLAVR